MKVAAPLFQAYMPAQPLPKTPIFTVYVPTGRFDGMDQPAEKLRVTFAENDWLSQKRWNTFWPDAL